MTESATIEVWAEDREGPAGDPHVLALTAVGRATDGSWLTPADAIGGEAALARAVRSYTSGDGTNTVDTPHLARVLAENYPGARLSFHLACGGPGPGGEQPPRLISREVSLSCGRCG